MRPKYGARQQQKHGLGNRTARNEGSEDRADKGRARNNSQRDKSHEKGSFPNFSTVPILMGGNLREEKPEGALKNMTKQTRGLLSHGG